MKKVILFLAFFAFAAGMTAQNANEDSPAQKATEKLVQLYTLDARQTAEVLKIQERKYRNLAEIDPLKVSDPALFSQKVRALQHATDKSLERHLTKEQLATYRKQQLELREKKAETFKEMTNAGASQNEIEYRMLQLDLESLQ